MDTVTTARTPTSTDTTVPTTTSHGTATTLVAALLYQAVQPLKKSTGSNTSAMDTVVPHPPASLPQSSRLVEQTHDTTTVSRQHPVLEPSLRTCCLDPTPTPTSAS